jgi:hypothetical protein
MMGGTGDVEIEESGREMGKKRWSRGVGNGTNGTNGVSRGLVRK